MCEGSFAVRCPRCQVQATVYNAPLGMVIRNPSGGLKDAIYDPCKACHGTGYVPGVVLDAMEDKEAVLKEEINVEALIVKVVEAVFKVVLDTVDVVDLLVEDAVAVLIYNVDNPGVVVEVLVFEVIDDGLVDVKIVVPSGDEVKKEVVDIVGLVK